MHHQVQQGSMSSTGRLQQQVKLHNRSCGLVQHTASARRRQLTCNASAGEADIKPRLLSVPEGPAQQTAQAINAVEAAWRAGIKRQRVEMLLPLIGATDLDDWPGGIRQQFKAASPLVENILRGLKKLDGLTGPLDAKIWDDGDAVGAWTGQQLAGVLFPTASVFARLTELAERPSGPKLVLIFNPQWELKGNLMNDFGFGQRRIKMEAFADSFENTYYLRQFRVYGDTIRIFRAFPNQYQVLAVDRVGKSELLGTQDSLPSYAEVEALLKARPSSAMNQDWVARLKDEYQWTKNSLNGPR